MAALATLLASGDIAAQFRASRDAERAREGLRVPQTEERPSSATPAGRESTSCGCAPAVETPEQLLASMQLGDEAFVRALRTQGPEIAPQGPACTPFALTRDRQGTVQALALHAGSADGGPGWLLTLSRDRLEGAVLLQSERIDQVAGDISSVTATLEAVTTPAQSVRAALPPEVLFELRTLLPMLRPEQSRRSESEYLVRIAFDVGTSERWARLLSAELIDRATGNVISDTFWVDRSDLPGGFYNPDLGEFEHYFWTNPLSFTRISRGVGRSRLTMRAPRASARTEQAAPTIKGGRPSKAASGQQGSGGKSAQTGKQASTSKQASGARQATGGRAPQGAKSAAAGSDTRKHAEGRSRRPVIQVGRQHIGVDYAAPTGTPVIAVADGVVSHQGWSGAYGNLVILAHPGGYTTHYAHLVDYAEHLRPGSEVRRGTEIGYVGSTGRSTGPHLHYEIRQAGRYLDPLNERVDNGPWQWSVTDRLSLLRQILLTDALAATRPMPVGERSAGTAPKTVRRCAQEF
ncbi:MAG: hypothetical protein RIS35_1809 [Pseudomonadota bacterium]